MHTTLLHHLNTHEKYVKKYKHVKRNFIIILFVFIIFILNNYCFYYGVVMVF